MKWESYFETEWLSHPARVRKSLLFADPHQCCGCINPWSPAALRSPLELVIQRDIQTLILRLDKPGKQDPFSTSKIRKIPDENFPGCEFFSVTPSKRDSRFQLHKQKQEGRFAFLHSTNLQVRLFYKYIFNVSICNSLSRDVYIKNNWLS